MPTFHEDLRSLMADYRCLSARKDELYAALAVIARGWHLERDGVTLSHQPSANGCAEYCAACLARKALKGVDDAGGETRRAGL